MIRKFLILFAVTGSLAVSACNTVEGAAKDVKSTADCADGKDGNC